MLKRHNMTNIKKLIIILIFALISSLILVDRMGKKLNLKLYSYINDESKRLASNIVNYSIHETIETNLADDLFEITKNQRGEIELLDYDTKEVNKLLKVVNKRIQKELLDLEEGNIQNFALSTSLKNGSTYKIKEGIICEVPLGILRDNTFYSNFGPTIPIKMTFLGNVKSNIKTTITPYGFNSLVLQITLHIEVEQRITMPTSSKKSTLIIESPLTLKIIQGIIPEYYYTKSMEKITSTYTTSK